MITVAYSICAYLSFLGVFSYFAFFSAGAIVPWHVDSASSTPVATAVLINVLLILAFGVQHSLMARRAVKRKLLRIIPEHAERSTFVLASSIVLALVMWQWRPISSVLWSTSSAPVSTTLWGLQALGWLFVPLASFLIDHFDLFGLKQSFYHFRRTSYQSKGFVTPWLYRYVRHPMMTALLVAFWAVPTMTLGHLVLSVGMSVYILVGVHFEEKSLVRQLGVAYRNYQKTTPRFFPAPGKPQHDAPSSSRDGEPALANSDQLGSLKASQ